MVDTKLPALLGDWIISSVYETLESLRLLWYNENKKLKFSGGR